MAYKRKRIRRDSMERLKAAINAGKVKISTKENGEGKLKDVMDIVCGISNKTLRDNIHMLIFSIAICCNGYYRSDSDAFVSIFDIDENCLADAVMTAEKCGLIEVTNIISETGYSFITIETSHQYFRYK